MEVPVGKKARKIIVESSEDEDLEAGAGGSSRRVRPFVGLPAFSTLPTTLRQPTQVAAHGTKSTRQLPSAVADENEDQPVLVSVSLHVACACAQQVR